MGQSGWNDRRDLVANDQPMAWTDLDQDLLPWAPPRIRASFNWDGSPWTGDPLAILADSELFTTPKAAKAGEG